MYLESRRVRTNFLITIMTDKTNNVLNILSCVDNIRNEVFAHLSRMCLTVREKTVYKETLFKACEMYRFIKSCLRNKKRCVD